MAHMYYTCVIIAASLQQSQLEQANGCCTGVDVVRHQTGKELFEIFKHKHFMLALHFLYTVLSDK